MIIRLVDSARWIAFTGRLLANKMINWDGWQLVIRDYTKREWISVVKNNGNFCRWWMWTNFRLIYEKWKKG